MHDSIPHEGLRRLSTGHDRRGGNEKSRNLERGVVTENDTEGATLLGEEQCSKAGSVMSREYYRPSAIAS